MKALAKTLITATVHRLPWGAREALFEGLRSRMSDEEIVARCGTRLERLNLCASGRYGLMQGPVNDGLLLPEYARSGCYEPDMITLFENFFKRHGGGTYLDIGANIGLTTIPLAQNPKVKCLAFEPDPQNFSHLSANVTRNCSHDNVRVHQLALFAKTAKLNFSRSETNIGDHRLSSDGDIEVQAAPLDDFLTELKGAVAAKIDTQGAEPFIVAGGRTVLSRATLVVMEFSPFHMRAAGSDPNIVIDFLSEFEQIGLRSNKGGALELASVQKATDLLRSKLTEPSWHEGLYYDVFAARQAGQLENLNDGRLE